MDRFPITQLLDGIRIEIDHGVANAIRSDYAGTAFWYQHDEVAPLAPLPEGSLRPSSWLLHALQMATLPVVAPVAALAALPGFLRFIRRARASRGGGETTPGGR